MAATKIEVASERPNELEGEVLSAFRDASHFRNSCGAMAQLQQGFIRKELENQESGISDLAALNVYSCDDNDKADEECDNCEPPLVDACTIDEFCKNDESISPFTGTANLLATVKKYEYIALVENAYAAIGNKPFKFKTTRTASPSDDEKKEAAAEFFPFVEQYLEENQVRVHELPEAFDLTTIGEVVESLAKDAKARADNRMQASLEREEAVMERTFHRANFMEEYMEALRDTTDYPIGVVWADDVALKRENRVVGGVLKRRYEIQCDAERVDPCYFWATRDHKVNSLGCAFFRLKRYTSGDLRRLIDKGIVKNKTLKDNINHILETHPDGFIQHETSLFEDHANPLNPKGKYDVLVGRGYFSKSSLDQLDIEIPSDYSLETYIPCEVFTVDHKLIHARVMPIADENLGVYTTSFRRSGKSIFGYSLHNFVYPFAKLYEGMLDSIDRNMGNSTSSIIQIDRGVVDNPEKYITVGKDGSYELDLSEDWIVEFDSSDVYNPNFRGFPIHIDQLPSNLDKLLPIREFIIRELEFFSGIPSILVNSNNISSALRTTSNYNASFNASAKVVKALLREGERRILKPAIEFFFYTKAASGKMKDFLIEAEPEILLSDTLTREFNDDQALLEGVVTLSQLGQGRIPEDKIAALINKVGREVYNLNEDLIGGVSPLASSTQPTQVAAV
jgi:hypothetical protein